MKQPKKKNEPIDVKTLIGRKILFCIKRDTIENSMPENAFLADVVAVEGGYVNVNAYMNDGSIVNEWKFVEFIRIIRDVGDARHTRPFTWKPAKRVLHGDGIPAGEQYLKECEESPDGIDLTGEGHVGDGLTGPNIQKIGADMIMKVGELDVMTSEMRHELTAVRHQVGTWMVDSMEEVEQDLYLESLDHRSKEMAKKEADIRRILDTQAEEIGMIKRVLTLKGLMA